MKVQSFMKKIFALTILVIILVVHVSFNHQDAYSEDFNSRQMWMTGYDKNAIPPLTKMNIKIYPEKRLDVKDGWKAKAKCSLKHGTKVVVIETRRVNKIRYSLVRDITKKENVCSGWVRDIFLSDQYVQAQGDLFQ